MDFNWPEFQNQRFDIRDATILLTLAGSKSYGTDTPTSDTDFKGVLVTPMIEILSPFRKFEQVMWKSEEKSGRVSEVAGLPEADEEGVIYGFNKFVNLASSCNPNIIEGLYVDERHIVHMTEAGGLLRDSRDLFLSGRAAYKFGGYAMSQLKRIRTHKGWLDNPPVAPPDRADFGLPPAKRIHHDQMGAALRYAELNIQELAPWLLDADNQYQEAFWEGVANMLLLLAEDASIIYDIDADEWIEVRDTAIYTMGSRLGFSDDFMTELRKEKQYDAAKKRWKSFQSWKKNRNPARAELEARYGYDCKHAMHLVRLLRMGKEVLTQGVVQVYRPDREELKEIRNGDWSYSKLIEWAEREKNELHEIERSGKSVVPKEPDMDKIEEVVKSIYALTYK